MVFGTRNVRKGTCVNYSKIDQVDGIPLVYFCLFVCVCFFCCFFFFVVFFLFVFFVLFCGGGGGGG